MQLYLALFLVGLCLWENCIAVCPDGTNSPMKCNPFVDFVCPEGYRCLGSFKGGQCCLEPAYSCPKGLPYRWGQWGGLYRCNGKIPGSGPCPLTHYCKRVEPAGTKIGVCCLF